MSKTFSIIQLFISLIGIVLLLLSYCVEPVTIGIAMIPLALWGVVYTIFYLVKKPAPMSENQKTGWRRINGIVIGITVLVGICAAFLDRTSYNWIWWAVYAMAFVQSLLLLTPLYPKE